jgi:carbon-monoxide dehydrogenase large subunit
VIGAAIRRVEDARFLTGGGNFVDDLTLPGMLHCAIVRSPHAHARIERIDKKSALGPGVVAVLAGNDMEADGVGPMRSGWALPGMAEPPRWALARDRARHVGEPVAAVFAVTKDLADDAAEELHVEYAALPAVEEPCFRWTRGDAAAVEGAFGTAAHVVHVELVNNRLCGGAIEPRGMVATADTLYCGTQAPHHIRRYVCSELGLAESELRLVSPDVGGGFG